MKRIKRSSHSRWDGSMKCLFQALLLVREVELMTGNDQVGMPVISVV